MSTLAATTVTFPTSAYVPIALGGQGAVVLTVACSDVEQWR